MIRRVFSDGIGERTTSFFKGFGWSMSAAFISRIVTGVTTLMAARWLGPKEFGEANLSLASILWIQVPLFLGLPLALVHYLSKHPKEKEKWISEGLGLMTILMVITLGTAYMFRATWARLLGIPEPFFLLAVLWCACSWPFSILRALLNALEKFAMRSWAEVLYAILFPLMLIFWMSRGYNSAAYILGLSLPYVIVGAIGLSLLKPPMHGMFTFSDRSKKMAVYAILGAMGAVAAALFDSPGKLIANKFLTVTEVGIISAYQGGTTQLAVFVLTAGAQVFFPIASRTPNKHSLFKKLNRILWPLFPVFVLVFLLGVFLYLKILGHNYPVSLLSCLVFSLAASMMLINGVLDWFVVSYGWRGILVRAVVGVGSGLINVGFCLWAIPRLHVIGAGLAYFAASAIGTAVLYTPRLQKWLNQGGEEIGTAV